MTKTIKLLVATHKQYKMPKSKLYLPIHVGSACHPNLNLPYQKDDQGTNISLKNPAFCELTALYWGWKNLTADYIGLCHYRRHFASPHLKTTFLRDQKSRFNHLLTEPEARKLLKDTDIIVPKLRKYYIETLYNHYTHTLHPEPLDLTRKIIAEKYPAYLPEFDRLKTRRSAHMFNMAIMKKEIMDDYCSWLFDILFTLEKQIKEQGIDQSYDQFHARFYGRISELLLDVYLYTNHLNYRELKAIDIEPVNWLKKGSAFLSAKFLHQKYNQSF